MMDFDIFGANRDDLLFKKPKQTVAGYLILQRRNIKIYNGFNTIGKGPESNIILRNKSPSEKHAVIYARDSVWYIKHLCPVNSTSLKSEKCKSKILKKDKWYRLQDISTIRIGRIDATVVNCEIAQRFFSTTFWKDFLESRKKYMRKRKQCEKLSEKWSALVKPSSS